MDDDARELARNALARLAADRAQDALIELEPMRGGLEAVDVVMVTARYSDDRGRPAMLRFVMKRLEGRAVREAEVYQRLALAGAADMSPRLLSIDRLSFDRAVLYIEAVRRIRAWPWRDISLSRKLLSLLARFHVTGSESPEPVDDWDYDAELGKLAIATEATLDRCRLDPELANLARDLRPLKRIVLARSPIRRQLLAERPFSTSLIHGDVHPGNAVVRRCGGQSQPVLLDWGRARSGSPLEDVSSWLHSLGFWETEARRRHDTLLADYLSARGMDRKLLPDVRAAYWLASACNALSGALLHHLMMACDQSRSTARRACAVRSAQSWLRIIRRADAWWS